MDGYSAHASGRNALDLADYVEIEKGRIVPANDAERTWVPLDEISLQIQASEGAVSVIGRLFVDDIATAGPLGLDVASTCSSPSAHDLSLTVSIFDFRSEEYDEIGKCSLGGAIDQVSRFT